MNLAQVTDAIFAHVRDGVGAFVRNVAVLYDATAADPPRDRAWCRVSVRGLTTAARTHGAAGSRMAERRAIAYVQIFAPLSEGDGPGAALGVAALIRPLLEGADLETADGTIYFTGADVSPIGTDRGVWYQANVSAQLTYQETI